MKIDARYAEREIDISATAAVFAVLEERLRAFAESEQLAMLIEADCQSSPEPYPYRARRLLLRKRAQLLHVHCEDEQLIFEGCPAAFIAMANHMPSAEGEDSPGAGYHIHFDNVGAPETIAEECPCMVFCVLEDI
ncbi:hypothetical protein [Vogesella indigofera]|uniref:hypothetical protein n=1 Tax=Vogesella indigofera TaxID=45465 RepID=UPI0035ADC7A1